MKKFLHILLFLSVVFMAGVPFATASTSHDHHEGVSNSPFEGKVKSHSRHCPLNGHHPQGQACPHKSSLGGKIEIRLAVDCGGNPNATVPTVQNSSHNLLLLSARSPLPVLRQAESIFIPAEIFQHFYPDPIDPPPRSS